MEEGNGKGRLLSIAVPSSKSRRGANPDRRKPCWLVGWRSLDDVHWDLGGEVLASGLQLTANYGSVEVELDYMGTIDQVQWLDVEDSRDRAGIEWAIRYLVDIAGVQETSLYAEQLFSGFAGKAMYASTRKMVRCGV
jgi:hypothetical protein